jgi:RNA polymerase sigma-70 factor (ECF subfamily)
VPLFRRRPLAWDEATPDEELVGRAQGGQREAFGVLYDRYLPRVYRYCYRLLGRREAAEDANGRVFLNALAALPAFRARSFRAWLFAIAHNVVVDDLRARRADLPLEAAAELHDTAPSPEEEAIAVLERCTILALLPRLAEDQRHVVALRLAGLSAAEIGEALGKPRNAVDGLQHRAVLRLQALVAAGARPGAERGRVR